MAIKKLDDVSPIMMDAIGNTLQGLMGENLKYVILFLDPSTGAFKIRSNADNSAELSKTLLYVGEVYRQDKKNCIQCKQSKPLDYFDGGSDPDKCYLCDYKPF